MNVFRLFWSLFSAYERCPQLALWDHGWEGVDLGQGPGKPKKFEGFEDSPHRRLVGTVIGKALEKFYADEMFRQPGYLTTLNSFVAKEWVRQTLKKPVHYERVGKDASDFVAECQRGVFGYLQTMKVHRLLGSENLPEAFLSGKLNRWLEISGYADLIVHRSDLGTTIIDFKDSLKKMADTDPDQLRWYALAYQRSTGRLPDRMGFAWLKYPAGARVQVNSVWTEESGVDWVEVNPDDLSGLADRAVKVYVGMLEKSFEPKPDPTVCRRCRWSAQCDAREEQRMKNAVKRKKVDPKSGVELEDGFIDFEP